MEPLSVELALVVVAIVIYVLCGQYLENYKARTGKSMCLHESAVVAVAGVVLGGILKASADYTVKFNKDLFFYMVLPPVIFAQGYTLKKKKFFRYFPYISFFGIVGTLVNFFFIGGLAYWYSSNDWITNEDCLDGGSASDCREHISFRDAMILASVLSASDDIAAVSLVRPSEYPKLSALIFGEGVLNDALSIVLFRTLSEGNGEEALIPVDVIYQIIVSTCIGVACGLTNARLLKVMPSLGEHPVRQSALVILFGFLSYGLAEFAEISGILTIFFCGVTMAHYSWHSLVPEAQVGSKITLHTLADIGEAFSFAYVGLSLWDFTSDHYSLDFSAWMFFAMCTSRLAMILGLSFVCSLFTKNFKLTMSERLAWSLGGMVRGAISWGQILQVKDNDMLITTTLIVVMSSTVFFGILLPVLIPKLKLSTEAEPPPPEPARSEHPAQGLLSRDSWLGPEALLVRGKGQKIYVGLAKWWIRFDESFMKPYFGGRTATLQRMQIAMPNGDMGIAGSFYRLLSGEEHPLVVAFLRMQQAREADRQLSTVGPGEGAKNDLYEQMATSFSAAYSKAGNDMSKASEIWLSNLSTEEQALLEAYQPFSAYQPPSSRGTLTESDSQLEDEETPITDRRPFGNTRL